MSRWEKRIFQSLLTLVTLSGLVYLAIRYAMENNDPFSVINHPLEPIALDLHVLTAPFLILAGGMLMRSHAWPRFKSGNPARRRSGMTSAVLFLAMVVSGYGLEVAVRPLLGYMFWALHIGFGLAFVFAYVGHLVSRIRIKKSAVATGAVAPHPVQESLCVKEALVESGSRTK